MQNNNNIQFPLIFQKNLFCFFLWRLLQLGLYGLNSPGVIYCLLLLTLTLT